MTQPVARFLVFFTSAAVLVLEVLAQRLLAPYLGVSLEVFTGVIGVILAGIALGAWMGGNAADRAQPVTLVGPLLIVGGFLTLAAPLLVDFVGPAVSRGGPVSIVVVTATAFLAPAAVLSAIPPVVVKARLANLSETGTIVGSFSAIGTTGAIVGTFLAGFVLIAAFPTRPTVIGLGIALIAGGLFSWKRRRHLPTAITGVVLLAIGLVAFGGPCAYETTYHCAEIVVDPDRPTGRTLVLDGVNNSYVDLDDPTYLDFRYARIFADVIDATVETGPVSVVSIGGGGFTFPGYLEATRPGTDHIVLEIDSSLIEIGRSELGLEADVDVVVGDARLSLAAVPTDSTDLVLGDAFSGLSVPWHLTTVEFADDIARVLHADGVYVINLIDYRTHDFARSGLATLESVFDHVAVIAPPDYLDGNGGGNFVLIGTDVDIPGEAIQAAIRSRGGSEIVLVDAATRSFVSDADPLRDDFAPVDQMLGRP